MTKSIDDRSPSAKAMAKASEITSICLLMIIPALLGYFLDQKVGTVFLFTVLGLIFGMGGSIYQLMGLVSKNQAQIENVDLSKIKKFDEKEESDSDSSDWDSKEQDDWD